MKKELLLIALIAFTFGQTKGWGQVNEVFVKNYHSGAVSMWVNGAHQGIVPSGKTAWIEAAGFVTRDSGVQPDGSIRTTHAYGGWAKRDVSEIYFAGHSPDGGVVFGQLSIPKEYKKAEICFAGSPPPEELELERAIKLPPGNPIVPLNQIRTAAARDFLNSPEGRYSTADGKLVLDIRKADRAALEAVLQSFGNSYPLAVARRAGALRLSSSDGQIELDAKWTGEQLELVQGSTTKILQDRSVARQLNCELAKLLGSGDVQVTLNWQGGPDVDLHVVDPNGEEISFNRKQSQSGGMLDVDDIHGPGPENIYWKEGGAPKGTYKVYVALFEGNSASWRVRIKVDGKTSQFSGTLNGEGQREFVVGFERK